MAGLRWSQQEALIAVLLNASWHTQAVWPPLRLPELLSVESSPILPCMHYLVFFLWTLKFSTVFPLHSVSLSALDLKFVPFSLATMTEVHNPTHYTSNNHVNPYTNAHSEIVCRLAYYWGILSSGRTLSQNRFLIFSGLLASLSRWPESYIVSALFFSLAIFIATEGTLYLFTICMTPFSVSFM